MKNMEVELKLQITEAVFHDLLEQFGCASSLRQQVNTFFDADSRILEKNRWALRLRKEKSKNLLTVKGPAIKKQNGVYIRPEYEEELTDEEAETIQDGFFLKQLGKGPSLELYRRFGDFFVKKKLQFETWRYRFPYKIWTIEMDKTMIKDKIFYELEVEAGESDMPLIQKELKVSLESKLEKAVRIFNYHSHNKG
jgi:uncharacterized protein YjbK